MNIINALPIPPSESGSNKVGNTDERSDAFYRLFEEKKDDLVYEKEGKEAFSGDGAELNDTMETSPLCEHGILSKEDVDVTPSCDAEDQTFLGWLIATGIPPVSEEESLKTDAAFSVGSLAAAQGQYKDESFVGSGIQKTLRLLMDNNESPTATEAVRFCFSDSLSTAADSANKMFTTWAAHHALNREADHALPAFETARELDAPTTLTHTGSVSSLIQTFSPSSISLSPSLGTPQWQNALEQQVVFFTRNDIHKAELRLHPEELGSLHIQLEMQDGKMNLILGALHSAVKGVLESAVPHLRTSLAEQGIKLQEVQVNDGMFMASHQDTSSSLSQQSHFAHTQMRSSAKEKQNEIRSSHETHSMLSKDGVSVFA